MKLSEITKKEYNNLEQKEIISCSDNKIIDKLTNIYLQWKEKNILYYDFEDFISLVYTSAKRKLQGKKIPYTSQDITVFSSELFTSLTKKDSSKNGEDLWIDVGMEEGIFISALINNHYVKTKQQEAYLLLTEDFGEEIQFLCYKNNGATIHIQGNCYANLCSEMRRGIVIITGNAGYNAGELMKGGTLRAPCANSSLGVMMQGGTIQVEGSTDDHLGINMNDGCIQVKKNTAESTGYKMIGGTIIIEGNSGNHVGHQMNGGSIHIKGNA